VKKGKKMMGTLDKRKQALIEQLKELNLKVEKNEISLEEYEPKKREIERELVEIMDRLTQLNFLLKV
jgi:chromosome segregation ATPase